MLDHLWLIPIWPLLGFLLNGFFGRRLGKSLTAKIGCGSVGLSLLPRSGRSGTWRDCRTMPVGLSR